MAFTIDLLTWLKGIVYDKEEVDDFLDAKSDVGHTHGDIYYTETEVDTLLEGKADTSDLPTKTSDLTNDGSDSSDSLTYIETSSTSGLVKNDGTIDTTTYLSSHQDISGKEDKSNKVSSNAGWGSTLSDDKYPSEKLTKQSLDDKISKSSTTGLVKNDGTIDTSTYLTEHQSLTNYVQKSSTAGLIKNDGTIDTNTYLTSHQSLSDIGGVVTVEKQTTAESGYVATYVVKQGGSQVGSKINIPKDYLVKSASLETCSQANTPVSGYKVGDKYLDFVINTKDSSTSTGDEHIYILVSDLIDTYTADNSTLQLSNNQFSKAGGVTSTELASNAVTTAKITDSNVTTAKIADGNVTRDKLASAVTDELDSKLEADDIDVSFNTTSGVLTITVGETTTGSS